MLIRCGRCGKPIYVSRPVGIAECGYCYAKVNAKEAERLSPDVLEWKKPLFEAAPAADAASRANRWRVLLGDPEAIQKYTEQQENLRKHWQELLEKSRMAWENEVSDDLLQDLIDQFSLLPENETAREWKEKLTQRLETRRAERRIASAREKARTINDPAELMDCLRQIEDLNRMPEYEKVWTEIRRKIERLEQEERERRKRIARRIRYRWFRRGAFMAACILVVFGYAILSSQVIQPNKLSKARKLAETGTFEEAEEAYLHAGIGGLFPNEEVQLSAHEELKALRNEWAKQLESDGEYERAATIYTTLQDKNSETRVRTSWAMKLETNGEWGKAIEQWKKVPDSEDKVLSAYTQLTLSLISEERYEEALNAFFQSDQQMLEAHGVTELILRKSWAGKEMEKERIGGAIKALAPVRDDETVADLYQDLLFRQMDDELTEAITEWQNAEERKKKDMLAKVQKLAVKYDSVNAQLRVWQMADRAGIDLTLLYPNGVEVMGLKLPVEIMTDDIQMDWERPLMMIRREKDYDLYFSLFQKTEIPHDATSESSYSLKMLPEFWQALPEERRAKTVEECTGIALVNMTYEYQGNAPGTMIVWDYTSLSTGKTKPTKKLSYSKSFMVFNAKEELLMWNPAKPQAFQADRKVNYSKYASNAKWPVSQRIRVDMTEDAAGYNKTYNSLGLCGDFDEQWAEDCLKKVYSAWR